MQRVSLITGPDGKSHFSGMVPERVNAIGQLVNGSPTVEILNSPTVVEWQPGKRREMAIILSGVHEYQTRTDKRRLFPGDIILIDDLSGEGHRFQTFGIERAISMRFPVGPDPKGAAH